MLRGILPSCRIRCLNRMHQQPHPRQEQKADHEPDRGKRRADLPQHIARLRGIVRNMPAELHIDQQADRQFVDRNDDRARQRADRKRLREQPLPQIK